MSRVKKILFASFVLAVGFGLALPFRKSADAPSQSAEPVEDISVPTAVHEPEREQVAAQMASTGSENYGSFDLQNHPSIVGKQAKSQPTQPVTSKPVTISPVTPEVPPAEDQSQPGFATISSPEPTPGEWPEEVVHVVRNGDTLEKLASRYLEDEARALEIFDLNRDQLTNPHLLPIGAELRIPIPRQNEID